MQQDNRIPQDNVPIIRAGKVLSVNTSTGKGQKKHPSGRCLLREDFVI